MYIHKLSLSPWIAQRHRLTSFMISMCVSGDTGNRNQLLPEITMVTVLYEALCGRGPKCGGLSNMGADSLHLPPVKDAALRITGLKAMRIKLCEAEASFFSLFQFVSVLYLCLCLLNVWARLAIQTMANILRLNVRVRVTVSVTVSFRRFFNFKFRKYWS